MIQTLDAIRFSDTRRVPINTVNKRRVLVEVASDRRVDMAIVTQLQFREFQNADDTDELSFDLVEGLRTHDFVVDLAPESPLSLLIWNSNEDADAFVAYKITDLATADISSPTRELVGVPD